MTTALADLVALRPEMIRVAYRMLGSRAEAEDVLQDAMARALASDADVRNPRRWLTTVVTNLCLDRLKSARRRREAYVGEWLPEPVVGAAWSEPKVVDPADPADRVTLDDEISLALMTVLETLSPAERAVYVLHEAFGIPLHEVAHIVGRAPDACRQLAVRARRHVQAHAPRFDPEPIAHARAVAAFQAACEGADVSRLAQVLDEQAVLRTDGGGVAPALPRPVVGRDAVARAIVATVRRAGRLSVERRWVNGTPGLVATHDGGTVVLAFAVADGSITEIDVVANPAKLGTL
ncbi:MAG: RNA polymerase sigma factor SigJ [Actinomycetota bacterium]|nr:RNA polymerase sigma factor SigJ [Actinomycetota bacterium]